MRSKLIAGAMLVVASLVTTGCGENYYTPEPGKISVVRGNPSDTVDSDTKDTKIQSVECPDSERKDIGQDVVVHPYHEKRSQRYYWIDMEPSRGDRPTVDFVEAQTADGVQVKVEGKFNFHTNFDCSGEGEKLVRDFDYQYGSRSFPVPGSGGDNDKNPSPWQGSDGWGAFLDVNVRPEIDDVISNEVGLYRCGDLNPACAALSNVQSGKALADASEGKAATAKREELEKAIIAAVNTTLEDSMGAEYLTFTDFKIVVNLPDNVQASLAESQAKYAALSGKQAELQAAELESQRQKVLSQNFDNNPAALRLELQRLVNEGYKNLPDGTTLVLGEDPRK